MSDYYIGIMSGTSVDSIDVILADFSGKTPLLIQANSHAWPDNLSEEIRRASENQHRCTLQELGTLDAAIGEQFAAATLTTLKEASISTKQITAIGCHGQTIFHSPQGDFPFSMQIGDPNRIAEQTGITTIADFRRRDIAAGGQGAPLVPAFHQAVFHSSEKNRAILNIGGMANLTLLTTQQSQTTGFDTGPGNVLMDGWSRRHLNKPYDDEGNWAASGNLITDLLTDLLKHPFFKRSPPKSTGRDAFDIDWVDHVLTPTHHHLKAEDVARTLLELTARSVCDALALSTMEKPDQLLVCGGGAHNVLLMNTLRELLDTTAVTTTEDYGIHPDWVEATAFAWLAKQTLLHKPGNLPAVTGARRGVILGAIYPI